MLLPVDEIIAALVTLLVVVDPIGLAPIFLSVTEGLPRRARQQVALRACLIAAIVLIGFAFFGNWLLRHLGISLPAFRIGGGLLLFAIAFEMVFDIRGEREARTAERAVEEHVRHIAAFPLAVPLMAGPGAITATMLVAGQPGMNPLRLLWFVAVIGVVVLATYVIFLFASRLWRLLGTTGNLVLTRLLGVVLAALAVQFVIDGIREVFGL